MPIRTLLFLTAGTLAAQPPRGEIVYREQCAKCHGENLAGGEGAPSLSGPAFLQKWTPQTLAVRTQKTMPPDDPGRLSSRQAADAAAYMLGVKTPDSNPKVSQTGEWRFYGGDAGTTKYTPLDQIDASNFNKLEVAWRFKTDNLGPFPEYKLEGTPLAISMLCCQPSG